MIVKSLIYTNAREHACVRANTHSWISWYMSELHGVDSIEVDVIDYLKGELAKV